MNQRVLLSNSYNMSLGFLPVLFTMILCELVEISTAFYIGTFISILASFAVRLAIRIPSLMLYVCTVILMCFSLLFSIQGVDWQYAGLPLSASSPFLLEVSVAVPLAVLYLMRNKLLYYLRQHAPRKVSSQAFISRMIQALESSLIAVRVLLIFVILHLLLMVVLILAAVPATATVSVFRIIPPFIFVLTILFNQYGLHYFNRVMMQTNFITVVDDRGRVKGKVPETDALLYKNAVTNAVVRIIPFYKGMMFVGKRSADSVLDPDKMDTPLESFIRYGEKVDDTLKRMLKSAFPNSAALQPHYVVMHRLRNEETSRVIYLFTLELTDEKMLQSETFADGKLWTLSLLEQNIQMNYFAASLEAEFGMLKSIIDTKEKYTES